MVIQYFVHDQCIGWRVLWLVRLYLVRLEFILTKLPQCLLQYRTQVSIWSVQQGTILACLAWKHKVLLKALVKLLSTHRDVTDVFSIPCRSPSVRISWKHPDEQQVGGWLFFVTVLRPHRQQFCPWFVSNGVTHTVNPNDFFLSFFFFFLTNINKIYLQICACTVSVGEK